MCELSHCLNHPFAHLEEIELAVEALDLAQLGGHDVGVLHLKFPSPVLGLGKLTQLLWMFPNLRHKLLLRCLEHVPLINHLHVRLVQACLGVHSRVACYLQRVLILQRVGRERVGCKVSGSIVVKEKPLVDLTTD